MDTRIYVMTHKQIADIPNEIYIPLHVGKEGKVDFGYIGDNTGDNISNKNANYCELTGMYWIWKNVTCDIVGICHYRRYFIKEEALLEKEYIENTLQKYDIIVPNSHCADEENVLADYRLKHNVKDLLACREVIAKKYPKYVAAFDYVMQASLVSIGNMWITRKSVYDRYCEWLFDILFEAEKRIDITDYDDYQKRVMGFLSERLFRVWLMMQPEKITEEQIKMIESCDFSNAEKRIDLIYKMVKLKMNPVIQMYRASNGGALITPFHCEDDFEGKIPVWICWWQGEDNMPELIRACVDSIKRNLPEDKVTLRFITLDNYLSYVTFTENIIRKFYEGKISMAQLSDILRAELLYRYGGMWIDTTYYVTKKIPQDIFEQNDIYTIRFKKPIWKADITQGRWSGNMWITKQKHNLLFRFLMECFWYYWETNDELVEYYLIDYIIAIAVEEFSEISHALGKCMYSGNGVFELQKCINKKYTEERMSQIENESIFYKLNRRSEFRKLNMVGEKTIYGHIVATQTK